MVWADRKPDRRPLLDFAVAEELDYYDLGIESFDNLTFGQRISTLAIIGNGLLRKDIPPVRLTAVLEGAIAAVFEHLKNEIALEIDTPEFGTSWRKLVGGVDTRPFLRYH